MQVSIQDDDGQRTEPFETGEICVIGPAVFAGYYDNPEANAKAFRDGWFRTGDLGHMDEEGFVYITGRASDMYISGGSNIYPREVEEKILTHPAIAEVAVARRARSGLGRGRRRRLRGARGRSRRERGSRWPRSSRAKVPRYKMPKRFFFWDALPKSGYGKVPKRLVRDELEARGLLDGNSQPIAVAERCEASSSPARRRPSASNGSRRGAAPSPSRSKPACRCWKPRAAALPREGFAGGVLNIRGGALGPFAYVMPALSKTGANAAFYSDTFRPAGVTRLKMGAMTLGQRDGAPFFHCHALWTEADGRAGGGHILPEETVVAEPFEVEAFGIDGAMFVAEPDPETNFKLFGPVAVRAARDGAETDSRAFALRLRPNQDFAGALESVLPGARDYPRAKLHGGVGSTIGARFADGAHRRAVRDRTRDPLGSHRAR